MLDEISAAPFAELVLVVVNGAAEPSSSDSSGGLIHRVRRWLRNRDYLLYALYCRLDEKRHAPEESLFDELDLTELLSDVPALSVTPRMTRYSDYLEDGDIREILSYDLDVALRLGFRILRGEVLDIARYGIWSYHHGDEREYRGGPPGFWEVMEGTPVTGAVLQVLSEELDGGTVIYRSLSATDGLSVVRNRENYYGPALHFVPRKLRDLHRLGPGALGACGRSSYDPYSKPIYRVPKNREMAKLGGRFARQWMGRRLARLNAPDQWALAYKFSRTPGADADAPASSFHNLDLIVPPDDRSWADPFPVEANGTFHVFFEEFLYGEKKGRICLMELDPEGRHGEPRVVLENGACLSYPFVFRWEDERFMIPTTEPPGPVELYRATDFPDGWTLEAVLLDGIRAVDTTLSLIEGRWWMFTAIAPGGTNAWDQELHVFHAPDPTGPWTPHDRNPVKSDVRSSRPAGRLFRSGGCLYRPARNGATQHGRHSITINRIGTLDESHYEETATGEITPSWRDAIIGMRTVNAAGGLTVIDGLMRR